MRRKAHFTRRLLPMILLLVVIGCFPPALSDITPDLATPSPTLTVTPSLPSTTLLITPTVTMTRVPPTATLTPTRHTPVQTLVPTSTPPSLQARVDQLLAQMSVEEKVGQLFGVYFKDSFFSPALEKMITQYHIGGIIIFTHNVASVINLAELINEAQATAIASSTGIPLFVAIDQEGGPVVRLTQGATVFPSNMAVGATGSTDDAELMARTMATEMKALGINMNLAPVLDVNNNPTNPVIGIRSFGSSPELVARLGVTMIKAYQESGIIATAKHFPGHGDTTLDSHTTLPSIPHDLEHLEAVELVPFKEAIAAGVDAIMTAHVAFPAVDPTPDQPATFSPLVLEDLLRENMGFQGLIATDSLGMGAIDRTYGVTTSAIRSFQAGADLLLFGNDPGHSPAEQPPVYDEILRLVRDGSISMHRLDESVRRILLVKAKYGILDWQPVEATEVIQQVGTTEHLTVARRVALDSITLVRDDSGILPIKPESKIVVIYPRAALGLGPALKRFSPDLDEIQVGLDPSLAEINDALQQAQSADAVIVGAIDVQRYPEQIQLVEALSKYPIVVVALSSPYDLLAYPTVPTYLAMYGDVPVSLDALGQVLFGVAKPRGHLPVELPGLYPLGHGLNEFPKLGGQ